MANGEALVLNCVAHLNASRLDSSLSVREDGRLEVVGSIVRDESDPFVVIGPNAFLDVRYCNVVGGFPGPGNIDADPRWIDPLNLDFRLGGDSPCIDAGDTNEAVALLETDLDGNPRFVGAFIDQGPHERQDVPDRVGLRAPEPRVAGAVNVLEVGGGTPDGEIGVAWAAGTGSTPIPFCPGVEFGLANPTVGVTGSGNVVGYVRFEVDVPDRAAGRTIFLQALDREGCATSDVVAVTYD